MEECKGVNVNCSKQLLNNEVNTKRGILGCYQSATPPPPGAAHPPPWCWCWGGIPAGQLLLFKKLLSPVKEITLENYYKHWYIKSNGISFRTSRTREVFCFQAMLETFSPFSSSSCCLLLLLHLIVRIKKVFWSRVTAEHSEGTIPTSLWTLLPVVRYLQSFQLQEVRNHFSFLSSSAMTANSSCYSWEVVSWPIIIDYNLVSHRKERSDAECRPNSQKLDFKVRITTSRSISNTILLWVLGFQGPLFLRRCSLYYYYWRSR